MSVMAVTAEAGWVALALPVVGVFVLWLRSRLGLSEDTAAAVATASSSGPIKEKPQNVDQAITILARRLDEQSTQITLMAIYIPQLSAWGERGWAPTPPEEREPRPPMPLGLNLPT